MTAIDGRIYAEGCRIACPSDLQDAADDLERSGGVAWIGLMDPDPNELDTAAARFGLHPLAVEDAHKGHQRAKLERYGDTMFVVLRPAACTRSPLR
ncbi:CorA family divalent cation transporter [Streptomyces sp. NPDC058686]|uniref:CorA family divalent cation transporter n=1 Tax=Streptomyces sp. NPDC058686 TaxID=3346599 RepID=UPI00365EDB34